MDLHHRYYDLGNSDGYNLKGWIPPLDMDNEYLPSYRLGFVHGREQRSMDDAAELAMMTLGEE